ncbi:MAG: histidine phosphatase family protein [Elainellaceae cyanobacterium]
MTQTVWLARHGNRQDFVDSNWHTTAERPHDPGLSPDGIEQAQELAQRLKAEPIAHLFASPFLRTVETAHYVAEVLDLPIMLEAGFCEYLNPVWFDAEPSRLTKQALAGRFPRINLSYHDRVLPAFPETWEMVLERAEKTIRQLVYEFSGDILVIGHGATVNAAALGLVTGEAEVSYGLCSLTKLVYKGNAWVIELNGDVSHLSETEETVRLI